MSPIRAQSGNRGMRRARQAQATSAIATSVVVGLSALAVPSARAKHLSLTTNTIQISRVSALAYGNLLNELAVGSSETVSFTASGSAIAAGANVYHVDGAVRPAKFTVSASGSDMTGQNITISVGKLGTGSKTMPWRWLKADYNGTKTATARQTTGTGLVVTVTGVPVPTTGNPVEVFGGIEVEGADTTGAYSGTITVTANHQ